MTGILCIDVGNTHTHIHLSHNDSPFHWQTLTTSFLENSLSFEFFKAALNAESIPLNKIQGAIMASVVPAANSNIKEMVRNLIGRTVLEVHSQLHTGLVWNIQNEETLGADRIATAVAAHHQYPNQDCLVVDLGTASTLDVISKAGHFQGGLIAPGKSGLLQGLIAQTAQLPQVVLDSYPTMWGQNTHDCIRTGCVWGYHAMVWGLIEQMQHCWQQQNTTSLKVVLTGGSSKEVFQQTNRPVDFDWDPDLLMHGLQILYTLNTDS